MKINCKKHKIQEIIFYVSKRGINRKCSVCQLEYEIKHNKRRFKTLKNNDMFENNGCTDKLSYFNSWVCKI